MTNDKEIQRLEIKQLAEEVRYRWMRKRVMDVLDILNEVAIVIRMPHKSEKLSGFTSYVNKHFVVYINSSYTLGHERFTAAHELYHILYDQDILKREKLLSKYDHIESENRANMFAVEFLMPEDGVKDFFLKSIQRPLQPKHIIRLHNHFQVSYKAMLKRILQLGLCDISEYDFLVDYCSLENADILGKLTLNEGFDTKLIKPSMTVSIPRRYIDLFIDNYKDGFISYAKFSSLLNIIGKTPEEMGYAPPEVEE